MSSKNKKSAATGVRYTDAQKKEIVNFVLQYNSANGRGGQSQAANKFKVTPLTISAWLKGAGVAKAPKAKKAAKKAVKAAKVAKVAKVAKPAKVAKAAKPVKKGKKSRMGVRYTPEQKQAVVSFVNDYNAANGRGGQSQAAKKFDLSVLTVSAWLKAAGSKKPGKKTAAAKVAKVAKKVKPVKAAKAAKPAKGQSELEALKAAIRALIA